MSRTFAHRPHHARFTEPDVCFAEHDHSLGPCDLPTLAEFHATIRAIPGATWGHFRCRWDVNVHLIPPNCGCSMCTDQVTRRINRRRDRHRTRLLLRTNREAA